MIAQHTSLEGFGHGGESSPSLSPNSTNVHYSAEPKGLMFQMIPMSHIENRTDAQVRITPGENPCENNVAH
jgi:hypothetical protein